MDKQLLNKVIHDTLGRWYEGLERKVVVEQISKAHDVPPLLVEMILHSHTGKDAIPRPVGT